MDESSQELVEKYIKNFQEWLKDGILYMDSFRNQEFPIVDKTSGRPSASKDREQELQAIFEAIATRSGVSVGGKVDRHDLAKMFEAYILEMYARG